MSIDMACIFCEVVLGHGWSRRHIPQQCFKIFKIFIPIENCHIVIPIFRDFKMHLYGIHMQRCIYNSFLGTYLPADEYAKCFYCLAFSLNMKSGQIHWNILNMGMDMQESTIGPNILNVLKHY
jgi:hypothetical protein